MVVDALATSITGINSHVIQGAGLIGPNLPGWQEELHLSALSLWRKMTKKMQRNSYVSQYEFRMVRVNNSLQLSRWCQGNWSVLFQHWLGTWWLHTPSHYLNQCWHIANHTLQTDTFQTTFRQNKLQWDLNQNKYTFIQENTFQNVTKI